MTWDTDTQYTEHKLTEVQQGKDWWFLGLDGVHLSCPNDQCEQAPAIGETARLYGKGLGYPVRGIIIDGRVYSYRTEAEESQRHADWVLGEKRKKQELLEAERGERDARRLALPAVFQERLAGYEKLKPDWRAEFEPYELSVCEDAARIAAHFGSDLEALERFREQPWKEQSALIPGLFDGHSGNSWGAALGLAGRYMRDPALVKGAHGALCGLVGCVEYGCPGGQLGDK